MQEEHSPAATPPEEVTIVDDDDDIEEIEFVRATTTAVQLSSSRVAAP
jgi:hypothetical protein